jgi:UDP-N-acetylglucosamine 2-epimerase (hydrolysing)
MKLVEADPAFELHVFVTGMHMLAKYGYTCDEVTREGYSNIHKFFNQNAHDDMDQILSKTVAGLADYVREVRPDMIVIHGDRVEALGGASVGSLNNVLTGHIEGGEVSGTIDEMIRHAVTKLSHVHFVANDDCAVRLAQLGESRDAIHVIGSPDIDVMDSPNLPTLEEVRRRYDIPFGEYGILAFHPVTTETEDLPRQIKTLVDWVLESGRDYVVIYPNNDRGSSIILDEYQRFSGNKQIRLIPSLRFEYYLSLLRNASFIIGNSSAGVREAPHYGVPAINIGTRQLNRVRCASVLDVDCDLDALRDAMFRVGGVARVSTSRFGDGSSSAKFHAVLKEASFWRTSRQKHFVDLGK